MLVEELAERARKVEEVGPVLAMGQCPGEPPRRQHLDVQWLAELSKEGLEKSCVSSNQFPLTAARSLGWRRISTKLDCCGTRDTLCVRAATLAKGVEIEHHMQVNDGGPSHEGCEEEVLGASLLLAEVEPQSSIEYRLTVAAHTKKIEFTLTVL